uniref:Uncharacterized protein MANES_11G036400 n=1 Tax=Rhizophora mucronata TaxID=61149 RepID=A0A2P2LJG9_RHIMU
MGTLQLSSCVLASLKLHSSPLKLTTTNPHNNRILKPLRGIGYSKLRIKAVGTVPESNSDVKEPGEPPSVNLAFVHARPLLNCAGGGTCGTCMVEVIVGKELLNPRTDKEKEKLKKKPKNWRLACQTTVGNPESTGMVVIQQLPEWKGHEWKSERILPSEISQNPD